MIKIARWITIKMADDDDEFGERDAVVCSECYANLENGVMYEEAPDNYKELEHCPVCGALMTNSSRVKHGL